MAVALTVASTTRPFIKKLWPFLDTSKAPSRALGIFDIRETARAPSTCRTDPFGHAFRRTRYSKAVYAKNSNINLIPCVASLFLITVVIIIVVPSPLSFGFWLYRTRTIQQKICMNKLFPLLQSFIYPLSLWLQQTKSFPPGQTGSVATRVSILASQVDREQAAIKDNLPGDTEVQAFLHMHWARDVAARTLSDPAAPDVGTIVRTRPLSRSTLHRCSEPFCSGILRRQGRCSRLPSRQRSARQLRQEFERGGGGG